MDHIRLHKNTLCTPENTTNHVPHRSEANVHFIYRYTQRKADAPRGDPESSLSGQDSVSSESSAFVFMFVCFFPAAVSATFVSARGLLAPALNVPPSLSCDYFSLLSAPPPDIPDICVRNWSDSRGAASPTGATSFSAPTQETPWCKTVNITSIWRKEPARVQKRVHF